MPHLLSLSIAAKRVSIAETASVFRPDNNVIAAIFPYAPGSFCKLLLRLFHSPQIDLFTSEYFPGLQAVPDFPILRQAHPQESDLLVRIPFPLWTC